MSLTSFFYPRTIYKTTTSLGSIVEVREYFWVKSLYIDGFPQSQLAYKRDWNTILGNIKDYSANHMQNALVLGLGGGDIISILRRQYPSAQIVAVELEPIVVKVAKDYFGVAESKYLKIVTGDAERYVLSCHLKFDLIIVDLYKGDDVASFVSNANFLHKINELLNVGGQAIFNYASHSFRQDDFERFEKQLSQIFKSFTRLTPWGHTYYLASR